LPSSIFGLRSLNPKRNHVVVTVNIRVNRLGNYLKRTYRTILEGEGESVNDSMKKRRGLIYGSPLRDLSTALCRNALSCRYELQLIFTLSVIDYSGGLKPAKVMVSSLRSEGL
jgi:hypothetical protein